MADKCSHCGTKLGFMERVSGATMCSKCKEQDRRLREQTKACYPIVLHDIWQGKMLEDEGKRSLQALSLEGGLSETEQRTLHTEAFRSFAEEVLADDTLTEMEEQRLLGIANLLGITQQHIDTDYRDILFRLLVARVNDGRLPTIAASKLALKKGEKAHLEMSAQLLRLKFYSGGWKKAVLNGDEGTD